MTEEQKRQLQATLWGIANELRGKMNAAHFRDYILGFIFYKYLSEKMQTHAYDILEADGITYLEIDESTPDGQEVLDAIREDAFESLGYFLKPSELFDQITQKGLGTAPQDATLPEEAGDEDEAAPTYTFILDDLQRVLSNIENSTRGSASEDDFDNLFEDLDLTSSKLGRTEEQKNALIIRVMARLSKIDFKLSQSESDLLGDAYEYLIGQFASGAGKKAGEFYTPREVSTLLAHLVTVGKSRLKSVYDPTCRSGSLLLLVAKDVKAVGAFYGQELNRTTYNLARMNMILHGVHHRKFDIRNEDVLEHPQHDLSLRFEAIVANPPFSARWSAKKLFESDDRFAQYGKLAPATKADFAFVQHMIHHLDDGGQMAVVLPHGVLFRGAAEEHIRKYLIEQLNCLDAVIGLPANIFYGTGIPTCVLVLKKCRENPDDILFIDASTGFEKAKNQNYLRTTDIDRIMETYRTRNDVEKFAHVATIDEIRKNDFNLNIPRYVDTFEEEEPVDLAVIAKELRALDKDMAKNDEVIRGCCAKLGIEAPF